jgi:hypothetical protein
MVKLSVYSKESSSVLSSPLCRTNTKCPPGATSTVRVGAGGGRLIVKQMGWMDMVKQKMET